MHARSQELFVLCGAVVCWPCHPRARARVRPPPHYELFANGTQRFCGGGRGVVKSGPFKTIFIQTDFTSSYLQFC